MLCEAVECAGSRTASYPKGWVCVRMNGSHAQYKHPDYRDLITVAGHGSRPIPEPLLKKILRMAEIDPSEV